MFQIVADARFELGGFVYNKRVAAWEPLIEPSEDVIHSKYRRWEMIAKASAMPSLGSRTSTQIVTSESGVLRDM